MKRSLPFFFCQVLLAGAWADEPPHLVDRAQLPVVAQLKDTRIRESSGLIRSFREDGVFWTLNDSGGEPCLYAIDTQGQTRAKVRLPEAVNFDWEDLSGYRDASGRAYLFIGDIGDNLEKRTQIQLYQLEEPPLPSQPEKEILVTDYRLWTALYPDRAHNAESLLTHPVTGQCFILTKQESGDSGLYAVPLEWKPKEPLMMQKVASLHFPTYKREGKKKKDASLTTGADFSPDARHLVVSSYSYLHEWDLPQGVELGQALQKAPRLYLPPYTAQMEAVCYDSNGRFLWFTSERLPTPLYRIPRVD